MIKAKRLQSECGSANNESILEICRSYPNDRRALQFNFLLPFDVKSLIRGLQQGFQVTKHEFFSGCCSLM